MLKLNGSLRNLPVLSLRSGGLLATAKSPLIDPDNLKVVGWFCNLRGVETVLLAEDVRDFNPSGLVVDDEAALSSPADLVRLQNLINMKYDPLGKLVKTDREKLGKVADYAYDDSLFIQQLYVEPPLIKFFGSRDTRVIGRNQVKEVTDAYILVGGGDVEVSAPVKEAVDQETHLPETA